MTLDNVDVDATIERAEALLKAEKNLSPALRSAMEVVLLLVSLLVKRLNLNSKNSSKPPSSDPDREKKTRSKGQRKPGGQAGHQGSTLEKFEDPDEIQHIEIDRRTLPKGHYHEAGFEARQVVEIDISRLVTEYRAQVLVNEAGQRFVAAFPEKVSRPVQYGDTVKAHAVYLSQFQLLPYNRVADYFKDQLAIPLSEGSIYNFNVEAAALVTSSGAEAVIKQHLQEAECLHVDETGINIGGKKHWLHGASTPRWTYFYPHKKRGTEAMDEAGIIPVFTGILCHDHWKPYYTYSDCLHALCNAHHLRELERAWEQDGQQWAKAMQDLLKRINIAVLDAGGQLSAKEAKPYRADYKKLLRNAEKESPPPDETQRKPGQRGKLKRSKARCLLDRLIDYENDVLRFMENETVPFTNNQGENDIRMTKVQQKISGCFRSMEGAQIFCLTRSYISSCRKQTIRATEALTSLFMGKLPGIFSLGAE